MTIQITTFGLAGLLAVVAPVSATGQVPAPATEIPQPPTPADPPAGEAPAPEAFAAAQGAVNLFAIRAAEIALDRGASDRIRGIAQQFLDEHNKAQAELRDAANAHPVPFEPRLDAAQERKLQAIRNASDEQFDNVYLSAQMVAHQAAMQTITLYEDKGAAGALKVYAKSHYPVLRNHYLMARTASAP
jgi:putative membrane protein